MPSAFQCFRAKNLPFRRTCRAVPFSAAKPHISIPLDLFYVQHAPIDRSPSASFSFAFTTGMKLRTTPSSSLPRLFLADTTYANRGSRRGFCIQCRQQLHEKPGSRSRAGALLRLNGAGLNPSARRPFFALPATIVAGQRRSLATVQNGGEAPPCRLHIQC
jgi:hypothetical protein